MNSNCIECRKYPIKRIFYPDNLNCFCQDCIQMIASESERYVRYYYHMCCTKVFIGDIFQTAEGPCQYCEKMITWFSIKYCSICNYFYCIDCRSTHVRDHIRKIRAKEVLKDYLLDDIVN